ncbi:MAG: caspase family protein [Deltaproteobacteria bacterium]|nr:caspase family protein [Deltaproteobacteria bacterium]
MSNSKWTRRMALGGLALGSAWLYGRGAHALRGFVRAEPGFNPTKTRALVVGVLQWQSSQLHGFPATDRKDAALVEQLVRRGVPRANITFLRDQDATQAAIRTALARSLASTRPDETLLVYYAGHGARTADGKTYFMPYDADPAALPTSAWDIETLVEGVTSTRFAGSAWLMADCCYSGALTELVQRRNRAQHSITTLTSSLASVLSTGNWTFTECVIAALSGESICDVDRNRRISLGDLQQFTRSQMAFVEQQLASYSNSGAFSSNYLLGPAQATQQPRRGEQVEVRWQGQWFRAQIISQDGQNTLVHYVGFPSSSDEVVTADRLRPFAPRRFAPRAQVEVEWNARWYPATVLEENTGIHRIHYDNYEASWDEWVASTRIRPRAQAPVAGQGGNLEVEWNGQWYAATALRADGTAQLVHYDGFGSEWDEWVPATRVRPRRAPSGPRRPPRRRR